jgi:hypothetical protein
VSCRVLEMTSSQLGSMNDRLSLSGPSQDLTYGAPPTLGASMEAHPNAAYPSEARPYATYPGNSEPNFGRQAETVRRSEFIPVVGTQTLKADTAISELRRQGRAGYRLYPGCRGVLVYS